MRNIRTGPLLACLFSLLSLLLLPWPAIIPALVVGLVIAIVTRLGFEQWWVWTRARWLNPAILLVLFLIAWNNGWPMNGANEWLWLSAPLWCVMVWRSYRWAWRSLIGETIEAGEGSASVLNRVLPAIINARWANAGARLGWKLNNTASQWIPKPSMAVPLSERIAAKLAQMSGGGGQNGQLPGPAADEPRPFGVAVNLSETRPWWLRPTIQTLPGTPEWPAAGLVKAAKRTGEWWMPVPARQAVYGASGHGKSVLLLQYTLRVLRTGARVLFIDGKGATKDALELFAKAEQAGAVAGHQQRWWRADGGDAFSLFRGLDPFQQLDCLRTMRQAQVGDAKVNSHYEDTAIRGWAFALKALADEKAGAAPSLADLRDRLDGLDGELNEVIDKTGATVGKVAGATLDHVTRSLLGTWDAESPSGWSPVPGDHGVDAWWLGVVSAPAASDAGRAAVAGVLYRLAVEAARATDETSKRAPLVIVVDEAASVFKSEQARSAIETLIAQGRSAGYSITLAFQDPGQLDAEAGDHFRRMVETNSELVWLGRIADSGRVLELGGNRFANEATRPGIGSTGNTSVRAQTGYGISPSIIEQLPLWTWGVFSRGKWTGVLVPPN